MLSTFYYQYDIHYHYGTLILPVLIGGHDPRHRQRRSMAGRQVLVGVVAVSTLVTAYLWGPTPIGRDAAAIASPSGDSIPHLEKMHDLIPDDAVLSAFYGYVPHFDHREEIYMFPNPFKGVLLGDVQAGGPAAAPSRPGRVHPRTDDPRSRAEGGPRLGFGATTRRSTRRATSPC